MRRFEKMIIDFTDILEKTKIDYVIVGGIAVSSWGNPRTTKDLDVIIVLKIEDIDELSKNLQENGFSTDREDIKDALKEKTHFTIFDKYSEYHIDAKGAYNEFDALTIKNKLVVLYEGHKMCIASPEDTIAHKLLFGGHQDIKDAQSILVRQSGKIDKNYLEELCENLGVLNELETLKERIKNDQIP